MLAVLLALVAAAGFAISNIFARLGLQGASPRTGAVISVVPALMVAAIPALIIDIPGFFEIPWRGFVWLALIALLAFPVGTILGFTTVNLLGAARGTPFWSSAHTFAIVLAIIFLGERPNEMIAVGIVAVAMGIIQIVREGAAGAVPVKVGRGLASGYAFGLATGACYGVVEFMAKVAVTDYASPLVTATVTAALGTIMFVPLFALDLPVLRHTPKRPVAMLALAGTATGIGVVTLYSSLERGDLIIVSPLASIGPLITLVLAHVFLQRLERLTIPVVLGAFLVVVGSVLVVMGDLI